MTRSEKMRDDVAALIRARNTLLWIVTREEARVEASIIDACETAQYIPTFWDCALGIQDATGAVMQPVQDPGAMFVQIRTRLERRVWVLRDIHKWLADPTLLRPMRSLARSLQGSPKNECRTMIVLAPTNEVPPELAGHAVVLDWPLPDREEIAKILDDYIKRYPDAAPNGVRERAIDAAVGLTAEEAASCYARSMVSAKKIDPLVVANEKKRVIAREKVLTWYDPDPRGLDAIGGLDLLKPWLMQRKAGFTQKARAFGLPVPKGVFLVGVPGCGKSLTAKAVATAYGMPLLRLDFGALRAKWVGDSEANIRKAFQVAEAIAPCVLWADEIEKALAGASGSQGDGGVASDALGTFLTWMQEKVAPVFVVATANDVTALPPELLRKGRFDEIFFVDLPTQREREAVVRAALNEYGGRATMLEARKSPEPEIDVVAVAKACDGFSGAEISAIVPDALFVAFADGERQVETADLITAADSVVPLSKTAVEKIAKLREWAKGRARPASMPEETRNTGARALDV